MKDTIVYYGGFALPDKNASANRVVSNGKLFDSLGYRTVFLGACYDGEYSGIRKLSENMFEEAHPATTLEWVKQILCFTNLKRLTEEYENLRTVILYNVPFVTLVLAKKYFSEKGITVAYDCTEWTQFTDGSFLKKAFKFIDEFFVRKFAHKIADKMIAISSLMEKAYKTDKKLLRLPPLVDIEDEIWHQPVENKDAFTFCFSGFPGGNKESLDKVVEAFGNLNNKSCILKIVGLTENDFFALYPDIKKIDNNVIFLGAQSHKSSVKNILNCDCYIFIRQSDRRNNAGFPTKFAESFTCGVPVITTNVSDIKEYVELSDNSVLLEGCNLKDIEDAMNSVLKKGRATEKYKLKSNFHYEEYIEKAKSWFE